MVVANQISIVAAEGRESELKEHLNTMVQSALGEKGCLKYELYQIEQERHLFFIIEIWKNNKAWLAHEASPSYLAFLSEASGCIQSRESRALKLTQCRSKLGLSETQD